ncbi:TPA: hypothetical protein EYP12_06055 [Candidatus Bipolaricaulota bacterium]|nr:hypothetical protein [Candidatus Bipolaricaulota bacterium]
MLERFLRAAYRIVRYRARWVLLGAAALVILALLYTFVLSPLQVRSSFLDLLPQKDELISRFRETQEALERIDYLQILIELKDPPEETSERERLLLEASFRVISHLLESPEIVAASVRPEVALPEVMILSGGQEELQELLSYAERIEARLPDPGIMTMAGETSPTDRQQLSELYRRINTALAEALSGEGSAGTEAGGEREGFDLERFNEELEALLGLTLGVQQMISLLEDPKGLERDIAGLIGALADLQRRAEERTFFSHDRTAILINARPRLSSQAGGVAYAHRVVREAREAIVAAGLDPKVFSFGLTGSYAFSAEGDRWIKRDMRNSTIIASIGVALILLLAFGRVVLPLLTTIPLFLTMALSLGWAKLSCGGLNLITSFLPSLIMGLGIDYGVHFLSRYLEERERGRRIGPAWRETLLRKGRATIIAGATTAVVLFSLLLARSRGIFEMGAIGGPGILLALLLTIFVLPSLVIVAHLVLHRGFRRSTLRLRYRLRPERPLSWLLRRKWAVVLFTIILSLAAIYPASQVRLHFVSQQLLPQEMESQLVRRRIVEGFELEELKLGDYFVFFAQDRQELQRIISGLREIPLVESVESLADYLTLEIQLESEREEGGLNLQERLAAGRTGLELVRASLGEQEEIAREAEGLIVNLSSLVALFSLYGRAEAATMVNSLIQGLLDLISTLEQLEPEEITANIEALQGALAGLATKVEELFPAGDPFAQAWTLLQEWFKTSKGEFIIYAKVDSDRIYQPGYYKGFIEEVSKFSRVYYGAAMIQDRLEGHMKRDFWMTTAVSAGLILALLLWGFRRPGERRFAPLALLPLILGYLWMLAGMRLLGLEFNFTNILISPLLIGLGVDNGVHILHRYLEDRRLTGVLSTTALAIFVTSATTMLVFAALLLARTPGLRLLGQSALLGLGFNALFSLTFLPALLALRVGNRNRD